MRQLSEYINTDIKTFPSGETVAEVQDFFADVLYSHFPIIENDTYIGNISAVDVETFEAQRLITDYRYALEGFFVRNTMNWLDVLEVFARNNANIVPILDENNKYIGYYEITDI